jgi:C4-dicarboxylate-specific signal transduction histidine kinase
MNSLRDILINLLSNAIWAIGGYTTTRILLFKKIQ